MPPAGFRLTHETEIKKSRFIADVARTDTEHEARAFIATIRALHPQARHHCTAYVICTDNVRTARSSDDGEPSGTAGIPMLNVLAEADVENVTCVVTRYFGGIKLGAGGLARAYGGCVSEAIASMPHVARDVRQLWDITVSHGDAGRIREDLTRSGATIVSEAFGAAVVLSFTSPGDVMSLVARITQGAITPTPRGLVTVELDAERGARNAFVQRKTVAQESP